MNLPAPEVRDLVTIAAVDDPRHDFVCRGTGQHDPVRIEPTENYRCRRCAVPLGPIYTAEDPLEPMARGFAAGGPPVSPKMARKLNGALALFYARTAYGRRLESKGITGSVGFPR